MATPSQAGVARTLDMLDSGEHVHTFASVGPPGFGLQGTREPSQLRIVSILWVVTHPLPWIHAGGVTTQHLVPEASRVPRIQVCRPHDED